MSGTQTKAADLDQALLEAAAWRMRISSEDAPPDAATSAEFARWLAADPSHAEAFDRATAAWGLFEPHGAAPEIIRARRDALDYARRSGQSRWLPRPTRREGLRMAAGLAVAAVLGAGLWPLVDGVDVYRTDVGQRRVVTLADGSTVALDARTQLRVRYTEDARRLELRSGQARFDVAHNPFRPFSVTAGDRTVVATGTAFNIDVQGKAVQVTLIEGSVVVAPVARDGAGPARPGAALPKPVTLRAGQRLATTQGSAKVATVNLEDATAWQRGKLIFENVPLADAVERVNRYSPRQVVIDDPAVGAMQVSGVFQTGDAGAFARAMAQYLSLTASFEDRAIILGPPASS
jgi:transmembrane sensor